MHRKTGVMFGGKKNGTHIGYSKLGALKSALTLAEKQHSDYRFVSLSFALDSFTGLATDGDINLIPRITLLEGD
jgi:hypothetical protein